MSNRKFRSWISVIWVWIVILLIPLFIGFVCFVIVPQYDNVRYFFSQITHSGPVFFGIELGDTVYCDQTIGVKDDDRSRADWLMDKYRNNDRPYSFGGIRLSENVEAMVCRIDEFYGQNMALVLVTRHTRKIVGVVVAAKCRKGETSDIMREIVGIVTGKHKGVVAKDKLDSWQKTAMMQLVRRPSPKSSVILRGSCQLVCASENFVITLSGTELVEVSEPDRPVPAHTKEEDLFVLHAPDLIERVSSYCRSGLVDPKNIISDFQVWQINPQTKGDMYKEYDFRGAIPTVDYDDAHVYMCVLMNDYQDQIDADKIKVDQDLQDEKERTKFLREFYRKQEHEKNASAL